jgi:hypothetical protein
MNPEEAEESEEEGRQHRREAEAIDEAAAPKSTMWI